MPATKYANLHHGILMNMLLPPPGIRALFHAVVEFNSWFHPQTDGNQTRVRNWLVFCVQLSSKHLSKLSVVYPNRGCLMISPILSSKILRPNTMPSGLAGTVCGPVWLRFNKSMPDVPCGEKTNLTPQWLCTMSCKPCSPALFWDVPIKVFISSQTCCSSSTCITLIESKRAQKQSSSIVTTPASVKLQF